MLKAEVQVPSSVLKYSSSVLRHVLVVPCLSPAAAFPRTSLVSMVSSAVGFPAAPDGLAVCLAMHRAVVGG